MVDLILAPLRLLVLPLQALQVLLPQASLLPQISFLPQVFLPEASLPHAA